MITSSNTSQLQPLGFREKILMESYVLIQSQGNKKYWQAIWVYNIFIYFTIIMQTA